jgi:hypothetical protein
MLNPDPDLRPDIFEVLTLVSKLRGVDSPVTVPSFSLSLSLWLWRSVSGLS